MFIGEFCMALQDLHEVGDEADCRIFSVSDKKFLLSILTVFFALQIAGGYSRLRLGFATKRLVW